MGKKYRNLLIKGVFRSILMWFRLLMIVNSKYYRDSKKPIHFSPSSIVRNQELNKQDSFMIFQGVPLKLVISLSYTFLNKFSDPFSD